MRINTLAALFALGLAGAAMPALAADGRYYDPSNAASQTGFTTDYDAINLTIGDDFTYGNGVLAKINAAEWGSSDHGAAGTYDSGNPGADLAGPGSDPEGCAYCHDFAVAHGDAANPFRLVDQPGASGWNDTCLVCHATGDAGYDPEGAGTGYALRGHSAASEGKPADASHYGAAHINAGDGGRFCWDCHDPHGDRSGGIRQHLHDPKRRLASHGRRARRACRHPKHSNLNFRRSGILVMLLILLDEFTLCFFQ